MKEWSEDKINAAKTAAERNQSEESKQAAAQEFYTVYSDADMDKDGLLNLEEWKAFCCKYSELKASRNEPETSQTDGSRAKWF